MLARFYAVAYSLIFRLAFWPDNWRLGFKTTWYCSRMCVSVCLCGMQDRGNGLLETTLCFEYADPRTFRTYYVIADNTLGRRAEPVELHSGNLVHQITVLVVDCCNINFVVTAVAMVQSHFPELWNQPVAN